MGASRLSILKSKKSCSTLERLERLAVDYVNTLGNLGVLLALDIPGRDRTYVTAGHADADRTIQVTPGKFFQIGSQTKTVVTITLLLLLRERAISVDDNVHKYIGYNIDNRITIRHLMMNSSGIGEYSKSFQGLTPFFVEYEPRDLIALAYPQGQLFDPGAQFDYCNTGWVIACQIIEALTGEPYGRAVRRLLLDPLGLNSSWFSEAAPVEQMMRGYLIDPTTGSPKDMSANLSWAYGAGDGVCSIDDIVTLFASLMDPSGPTGVVLRDLTSQLGKAGRRPHFDLSFGTEYGLGIEKRFWAGEEVWGHPGSTLSTKSSTWIDPQRQITVATCVTSIIDSEDTVADLRYPRAQLFAMALSAAYALYETVS